MLAFPPLPDLSSLPEQRVWPREDPAPPLGEIPRISEEGPGTASVLCLDWRNWLVCATTLHPQPTVPSVPDSLILCLILPPALGVACRGDSTFLALFPLLK